MAYLLFGIFIGLLKINFQIKKIEKSGYFGELALVTHKPRAASAYACGDVKLACK